jgi:hypothetical protein
MIHEMNLCDLNIEDQIIIETYRECDEDGCRIVVNRITLFIDGNAVNMPRKLYEKVYALTHEYVCDLNPLDL